MNQIISTGFEICRDPPLARVIYVGSKYFSNRTNCETDLHIGYFFDGTNNNANFDIRTNSHSNIARILSTYPEMPKYGKFRHYIPGVGTSFPEIGDKGESTVGSAFGVGCEARVIFALLHVLNSIHRFVFDGKDFFGSEQIMALCRAGSLVSIQDARALAKLGLVKSLLSSESKDNGFREEYLKDRCSMLNYLISKNGRPIVKECFVDVFGFSRGAAEARVFCCWLSKMFDGECLAGIPVCIRFLGIFDTVASAGVSSGIIGAAINHTDGHSGWASHQFLKVPPTVKNCVHMVAMHELRKNFPLDEISDSGALPPNWQQFAYPGSHSDVGGGYAPGELGVSVGKPPKSGDALKLAQIPLNHMYDCAIAAGVPLNRIRATDKNEDDPFRVDSSLQSAFEEFIKESGTKPRTLAEWMQPYLAWRWQIRDMHNSTIQVTHAGIDAPLLRAANRQLIKDAELLSATGNVKQAQAHVLSVIKKLSKVYDKRNAQQSIDIAHLDDEAPKVLADTKAHPRVSKTMADFFDRYVHDSLAGFRKSVIEPTGYWRYRKGFKGDNNVTFVSTDEPPVDVA